MLYSWLLHQSSSSTSPPPASKKEVRDRFRRSEFKPVFIVPLRKHSNCCTLQQRYTRLRSSQSYSSPRTKRRQFRSTRSIIIWHSWHNGGLLHRNNNLDDVVRVTLRLLLLLPVQKCTTPIQQIWPHNLVRSNVIWFCSKQIVTYKLRQYCEGKEVTGAQRLKPQFTEVHRFRERLLVWKSGQ